MSDDRAIHNETPVEGTHTAVGFVRSVNPFAFAALNCRDVRRSYDELPQSPAEEPQRRERARTSIPSVPGSRAGGPNPVRSTAMESRELSSTECRADRVV